MHHRVVERDKVDLSDSVVQQMVVAEYNVAVVEEVECRSVG
jgi:hypothetical protein